MEEVICVNLEASLTGGGGLRHQVSPICLVSALTPRSHRHYQQLNDSHGRSIAE